MEKRAVGQFWFETPDKGRIDLHPSTKLPEADANGQRLNLLKIGANGQPFSVQADTNSRWVCTGTMLLVIDDEQKTYEVMVIPPHLQGQNISKSPLPFLFGVKSDELQRRYFINPGSRTEMNKRPVAHIIAEPREAATAKEWSRAEVILDKGTYFQNVWVPLAIKLLDPSGQQETVYYFRPDTVKLNQSLLFGNPFKEPDGFFTNYTCTGRHTLVAEEPTQRTVETPAAGGQVR